MIHRSEQIMRAVQATLTGLPTTATNVFRAKAYDFDLDDLPGLAIWQGDEVKDAEYSHDLEDWILEVFIEVHIADPETEPETALNAIRAEVTAALAADFTLGLAFVINMDETRSSTPDVAGEGSDRPSAVSIMDWLCTFRRGRKSAT